MDRIKQLPLPVPTHHMHGTREKFRVLADRRAAGQELFHPDDAKIDCHDPAGFARSFPRSDTIYRLLARNRDNREQYGND